MTKREEALKNMKVYVDPNDGLIHIENAYIVSKNFAGIEKRNPNNPKQIVNSSGNRNFSIELNEEVANFISSFRLSDHPEKAFKVQVKLPKEDAEDQTPRIFMTVKLQYRFDDNGKPWKKNPKINQYSSKGKTVKDEKNVDSIDDVFIDKSEIAFAPGPYDVNGNIGLTAWLRKLNYKIKEDDMEARWDQDYVTDDPTDFDEEVPFD